MKEPAKELRIGCSHAHDWSRFPFKDPSCLVAVGGVWAVWAGHVAAHRKHEAGEIR